LFFLNNKINKDKIQSYRFILLLFNKKSLLPLSPAIGTLANFSCLYFLYK
jgi:hypothetical protein